MASGYPFIPDGAGGWRQQTAAEALAQLPAHHSNHEVGGSDALTTYGGLAVASTWSAVQTFNGGANVANWLVTGSTRVSTTVRTGATALTTSSTEHQPCDATSGAFTITVPATSTAGYRYTIVKVDASANAVTVSAGTSIGGYAGSIKLTRQGDTVTLMSTAASGVYLLVAGTFNPLHPAAESLYTNLTVPAGNTVSASGTGSAGTQKVFTSGPTIAANYFYPGVKVQLRGWGYATATSGVTSNPTMWAGGTSGLKLIDAGSLTLPTSPSNARYEFDISLKCLTAGTSGTVECYGRFSFTGLSPVYVGPTSGGDGTAFSVTYDTTAARLIQLSTAYSSASSSDTNTLRSIEAVGYPPSVNAA